MNYLVRLTGDAAGPFNIYYDTPLTGSLVASNVSRSTLISGYLVTGLPTNAIDIRVYNTDSDCQNTFTYYLATPTPTPTPTATPTPTPTPTVSVVDCTLSGGSVSISAGTPTPTPTASPTPTPTATNTPTPTPTPTNAVVRNRASVQETSISFQSSFTIINSTAGGSTDVITGGTAGAPVFGKNDAFVLGSGIITPVTYTITKTAVSSTALDASYIIVYVDGTMEASVNFNMGDAFSASLTVNITSTSLVTIEIQEG
jgi:hypothetical protein